MGSVNLDNTGSGSAITLSSDGTSLLLDGTAIGGGGGGSPDLYAENPSSATAPVASGTNAVSIGSNSTATGNNSFAIGLGDGDATGSASFAVGGQATNTNAIAISNGSTAQGYKSVSIGNGSRAQGMRAVALGSESQALTNSNAIAIGTSLASGASSFAAAITNNTTSYGASSTKGISIGPFSQTLTGQNVISIGYASIGSGGNSTAVGYRNQATNTNAVALGSHARATGYYSLAISSANGDSEGALSSGIGSIAIGRTVTASHQDSAVLGNDVQSTATNQVSIGGSTQDVRISEVYTLPKVDGTASGQVLTTDGSGAVSWATPSGGGGGGALEFVSKTTVSSAVSYVDFTNLDDNAYYKLVGQGIKFSSSFNLPKIDFMNASNVVQSNCYAIVRRGSSILSTTSGAADINCGLSPFTDICGFELELFTKAETNFIFYRGYNGGVGDCTLMGSFDANNTSTRVGGLRFRPNSGTITAGELLLYKYKES